jgi:hypothetical protein
MVISWLITNYRAAHTPLAKLKKLKWFKPLNWLIRVDVDASFDEFTFTDTKGVVIWDSNGHTLVLENWLSIDIHSVAHLKLRAPLNLFCGALVINAPHNSLNSVVHDNCMRHRTVYFCGVYSLVRQ